MKGREEGCEEKGNYVMREGMRGRRENCCTKGRESMREEGKGNCVVLGEEEG